MLRLGNNQQQSFGKLRISIRTGESKSLLVSIRGGFCQRAIRCDQRL
jgi:hypothetical protein